MGLKKVLKTSVGVFTGSVAIDMFKVEKHAETVSDKLILKAAGSLAAGVSIQLLKEDIVDVLKKCETR